VYCIAGRKAKLLENRQQKREHAKGDGKPDGHFLQLGFAAGGLALGRERGRVAAEGSAHTGALGLLHEHYDDEKHRDHEQCDLDNQGYGFHSAVPPNSYGKAHYIMRFAALQAILAPFLARPRFFTAYSRPCGDDGKILRKSSDVRMG